jgi:hypothetical protein
MGPLLFLFYEIPGLSGKEGKNDNFVALHKCRKELLLFKD